MGLAEAAEAGEEATATVVVALPRI